MQPVRVAIIDDHPVVSRGLSLHVEAGAAPIEVVFTCTTVDEFRSAEVAVDVILLDLHLANGTSIPDIPSLVATGTRVLIYTSEQRPVPLREAVTAGASGVLLKTDDIEVIAGAVEQAFMGDFCVSGPLAFALLNDPALVTELSDKQRQALSCLDDGLDYRATAKVMGISVNTVKEHLSRVRDRFTARGIDPGNSHRLTRLAADEGHLR